jgi:hypothetical protein
MREIQFILDRNGTVERRICVRSGHIPPVGMSYLIHPSEGEGEAVLWKVVSVHGELFPGAEPGVALLDPPLSVERPGDFHEGDAFVVVLSPVQKATKRRSRRRRPKS